MMELVFSLVSLGPQVCFDFHFLARSLLLNKGVGVWVLFRSKIELMQKKDLSFKVEKEQKKGP